MSLRTLIALTLTTGSLLLNARADITNGLVLYLPLDETTGTTFYDATGKGNNGTAHNFTINSQWTTGWITNGVSLNQAGVNNQYITVPDNATLRFTNTLAFTIAVWIKAAATQADGAAVVAKGVGYAEEYVMDISANRFRIYTRNSAGTATTLSATVGPNNLPWQHVAGVYNLNAQTLQIYLNGVLNNSVSSVALSSLGNVNTHVVSIGARESSATSGYNLALANAVLDEVRMYNRALTASDVYELYAHNAPQAADYNITSYGATANDSTLDTTALQNAIDAAYNAGGGRVIVPSGKFRSGSLTLKNNVTLRLDTSTSVLAGSDNYLDYGLSFINADGGWTKRIEGPGIIDGVNCYNPNGEEGFRGPHCISFGGCNGFTVADITITNSANYALIGYATTGTETENITVQNVKIRGGHDGLHLQYATNITVQNCDFQTGDDSFAGSDNQTMTVTDCQINSSCNGMRLGAKNLTVKRCRFWGPGQFPHRIDGSTTMDSAYCYFSPSVRNPTIPGDNEVFEDCIVENVETLFSYNYGGQWQDAQVLKNVTLRNVTVTGLRSGFRSNGDTSRQFNLTLEGVDIGFRSGSQNHNCLSLYRFGTCTMKGVTLRNSGTVPVGAFNTGNYVQTNRVAVVPSNLNPFSYSSVASVTAIALPFASGTILQLEPQCALGKRLNVANAGTGDGANVQIWSANGTAAQKWKVTDVGGGVYELEPQHALSKRLDVSGGGSGDGVNVQIWSANGGNAQRWRFLDQGNDFFELTPLCAPYRRLDVYGAGTTDGVNVQIWQDIDGGAQRWKMLSPGLLIEGADVVNSNNIIIGFGTTTIDQASVAASDFAITNGSGARLIVTGVQLEPEDGRYIVVTTDPTTPFDMSIGATCVVTVNNLTIGAGATTIAPNSKVTNTIGGLILRKHFSTPGNTSSSIADLLTDPNFVNNSPDQVYTESTIEEPYVYGPFGLQFLGYFRPAKTANYTFYITGDGESQLYLSTDDSPAHQSMICSQPGWSAPRLWLHDQQGTTANNPAKVSAPIHLVAGSYFLQCLYKSPGNQNNNVSVTWSWTNALGQWQGVVDYDTPQSTNLVPWSLSSGAVWVTPGATNLSAGGSFRLDGRFLAGAGGPITYQWYRGATPVGNGTLTYSAASATPGDAGLYTLVATVTPATGPALNFTSAPVAVTVNLPRCTLTCANSAGTMLLSWGVTGVLEQSPSVDPALATWVPVPGAPSAPTGGSYAVPLTGSAMFYRLRQWP